MRRTRGIVAVVAILMTMCININVSANGLAETGSQAFLPEGIYEGDALQSVAETLGYEMFTEDGYALESISISLSISDTYIQEDTTSSLALGDYVDTVAKWQSNIYFEDSPLTNDWYDGPLNKISQTFSVLVPASYNCSDASAELISKGVGFDVEGSILKSSTVERTAISSNQRLNIKVYGLYDRYTFLVYNIWGNAKGSGWADNSVGIYVMQAIYSK